METVKINYRGVGSNSKNYRIMFELAKQEGVLEVSKFIRYLDSIYTGDLLEDAVFFGKQPLLSVIKRYKNIVTFLRSHKDEIEEFNFGDETLIQAFRELESNPELIDTYLENAKVLEELKVESVCSDEEVMYGQVASSFEVSNGQMIQMRRLYSDGVINYDSNHPNITSYFDVYSRLDEYTPATFLLVVDNNRNSYQTRSIIIKDFAFDSSKLPTEEELLSQELPAKLKLHLEHNKL